MSDKLYWVERGTRLEPGVTMSMWGISATYEQALDQAVDTCSDPTVEWVRIYVRPAANIMPPVEGTPIWHWTRGQTQGASVIANA